MTCPVLAGGWRWMEKVKVRMEQLKEMRLLCLHWLLAWLVGSVTTQRRINGRFMADKISSEVALAGQLTNWTANAAVSIMHWPFLGSFCLLAKISLLASLSIPEDVSCLLYLQVVIGDLHKTIVETPMVTGSLANQAPSVANHSTCTDIPEALNHSIWYIPCTYICTYHAMYITLSTTKPGKEVVMLGINNTNQDNS